MLPQLIKHRKTFFVQSFSFHFFYRKLFHSFENKKNDSLQCPVSLARSFNNRVFASFIFHTQLLTLYFSSYVQSFLSCYF